MRSHAGNIDQLIASYPRQAPPLPQEWQKIYEETYQASRGGKTMLYWLTQRLEEWMHRQVLASGHTNKLLEIGAGNLNHVKFERDVCCYDAVEPFSSLWLNRSECSSITKIFQDLADVPIDRKYNRIISIAALEHIVDLPFVIARSGKILAPGGSFVAAIPSEGGLLWGLSWRLSVGLATRLQKGLCYGDLMRHEHLSRADEIITLINYFFADCTLQRFPIRHADLSLYTCIHARHPIVDRCDLYAKML